MLRRFLILIFQFECLSTHFSNAQFIAIRDTKHFEFGPGEYMIHDLENIGNTDLIFTTVELKNSANPPLPILD